MWVFFFFNDTATTEIYTLCLHDALPISHPRDHLGIAELRDAAPEVALGERLRRSEEHTSELQSPCNLVCRLLLEKKTLNHTQHPQYRMTTPLCALQRQPLTLHCSSIASP